jgi:hypothetical protein
MENCIPNTTSTINETALVCSNFYSTDCIIFINAISYLNLPVNSTVTEVLVALTASLIDTRNRQEILEDSINLLEARIINVETV